MAFEAFDDENVAADDEATLSLSPFSLVPSNELFKLLQESSAIIS